MTNIIDHPTPAPATLSIAQLLGELTVVVDRLTTYLAEEGRTDVSPTADIAQARSLADEVDRRAGARS